MTEPRRSHSRLGLLGLALLGPVALLHALSASHASALGVLVSAIILWGFELIPLWLTALSIPIASVLLGIQGVGTAFAPLADEVIVLIASMLLFARAIERSGVDLHLARKILGLTFFRTSPERVAYGFGLLAWTLGMWISNTATCAMLLPIALGLADALRAKSGSSNAHKRLLFTCAIVPSIGGMNTPVGSLPNMIAAEYLASRGTSIGFLAWMSHALPFSMGLLFAVLALLRIRYPLGDSAELGDPVLPVAPPETGADARRTAFCFLAVIAAWILLPIVGPWLHHLGVSLDRIPPALPAAIGVASLFVMRQSSANSTLLSPADLRALDWRVLLLFGGGLCLGAMIQDSGLAASVGHSLRTEFAESHLALTAATVTTAVVFSEVASNTAAAAVLVPLVGAGAEPALLIPLVFAAVFACGLGFMLPVSTPPNALVFATGRLPIREMLLVGLIVDLIGALWLISYTSIRGMSL